MNKKLLFNQEPQQGKKTSENKLSHPILDITGFYATGFKLIFLQMRSQVLGGKGSCNLPFSMLNG